jgi:quinol monooxygenase YgiN
MIRHIVFFTLRSDTDRDDAATRLRALASIPGSVRFEVSANLKVDQIGNDIDIVVYAEFPDEAALRAYKAHPTYAATTASVRPLRELRFAADVEATG